MKTKTLKTGKRLLAMAVIMLMSVYLFVGNTPAFAAEIDTAEISAAELAAHLEIVAAVSTGAEDGFELVDEFTTKEDDGIIATTKVYVKEDITTYSSAWNHKKVTCEKVFTLSGFNWVKITVWGTFSYNGETAEVNKADGTAEPAEKKTSISIIYEPPCDVGSDCGSNFLLGNKYAYVEKHVYATNGVSTHEFKLWLDVNRNGVINTDPGNATYTEE